MHPLDGAWSKLEWAKTHVDTIRAAIPDSVDRDGVHTLNTRREYKANVGAVVAVVESMPELPKDLSLIIGDGLHNFRSSLDLAWWQLAVKHLARVPTDEEAASIQFPIRRPGKNFEPATHAHWVGQQAVDVAESVQPNMGWDPTNATDPPDPMGALRYLSNIDKHRVLVVTFFRIHGLTVQNPGPDQIRDCILDTNRTPDGSGSIQLPSAALRPQPGSEVGRIYVHATGLNPDVDFNPEATTAICVERWRLFPLFDAIGTQIASILDRFEPILKTGPDPPST